MQVAIPGNEKDIFKYPEYTAFWLAGFLTLVSKYLCSKSKANISEILSFVERSLFQKLSFHIYFVQLRNMFKKWQSVTPITPITASKMLSKNPAKGLGM